MNHRESNRCGIITCRCGSFITSTCRGDFVNRRSIWKFEINLVHLHNVRKIGDRLFCTFPTCNQAIGNFNRSGAYLENVTVDYLSYRIRYNLVDTRFKVLITDEFNITRIVEQDEDGYTLIS